MGDSRLGRIGVVLAVADVDSTVAFYRDVLSFDVDAVFDAPAYAILSRGSMRLSLAEAGHRADDLPDYEMTRPSDHHRPSAMLVIETDDCAALVADVRARGAAPVSEVYRPPWGGARAFIADPEGNLIELEELAG